jgi:hypothetical protein
MNTGLLSFMYAVFYKRQEQANKKKKQTMEFKQVKEPLDTNDVEFV